MDGNPIRLQQGFGAGVEMVNQAFDRNEQELRKRKKVTRLWFRSSQISTRP